MALWQIFWQWILKKNAYMRAKMTHCVSGLVMTMTRGFAFLLKIVLSLTPHVGKIAFMDNKAALLGQVRKTFSKKEILPYILICLFSAYSRIMIIGGFFEGDLLDDVEMFDLADSGLTCSKPAPFQFRSSGPVGYLREEKPFVCGGSSGQTSCWSYNTNGNIWEQEAPSLLNVRSYSQASLWQPNQWYVVGGRKSSGEPEPANELLRGDTFSVGPDPPEVTAWSCMTKVNGTHLFLGGGDTTAEGKTFTFLLWD